MKIYVLGSNSFVSQMIDVKNNLCVLGHDGWIHDDYIKVDKGLIDMKVDLQIGEHAAIKIQNNYLLSHYNNICQSDAIIIVNGTKNGSTGYIGGNCLIEMGQAYVNHKHIFLLNNLPSKSPYLEEIIALQPICLNGNLSEISNKMKC